MGNGVVAACTRQHCHIFQHDNFVVHVIDNMSSHHDPACYTSNTRDIPLRAAKDLKHRRDMSHKGLVANERYNGSKTCHWGILMIMITLLKPSPSLVTA